MQTAFKFVQLAEGEFLTGLQKGLRFKSCLDILLNIECLNKLVCSIFSWLEDFGIL